MDWTSAEALLKTDLDRIVTRASNPGPALAALATKVAGERARVEGTLAELRERLAGLPSAVEAEAKLVDRCDAIVAKAEGEGRDDLAAAALGRKVAHEAQLAALQSELVEGERVLVRGDELVAALEALRETVAARTAEFATAETQTELDTIDDDDGPSDLDDLGDLDALGGGTAPAVIGGPDLARPKPKAGEDLDAEFAELLAAMGESAAPSTPARAAPAVPDDDYALPDLVQIGEGELPEGFDPDSDEPIDFSAIDALAAREAGKAPPPAKGKSAKAASAKSTPSKSTPAKAGTDKPAGSKKRLLVVASVIVAAGGTVAALFAFGVLSL